MWFLAPVLVLGTVLYGCSPLSFKAKIYNIQLLNHPPNSKNSILELPRFKLWSVMLRSFVDDYSIAHARSAGPWTLGVLRSAPEAFWSPWRRPGHLLDASHGGLAGLLEASWKAYGARLSSEMAFPKDALFVFAVLAASWSPKSSPKEAQYFPFEFHDF